MWGQQPPQRPQGPQMPGLARGLAQQPLPQRPGAPMAPGAPAAGGPQPGAPGSPPPWGGMGNGWLQAGLQGLGQKLGAQSMPPGDGAPAVVNPGASRPGGPDRAAPVAQGATQYAQNATRQLVNEEDPRLSGRGMR